MTFTVGRRLGPNTRAPRGTPAGYIPRVSAIGTIIEWVSPDDILASVTLTQIYIEDGMGGYLGVYGNDGNPVSVNS